MNTLPSVLMVGGPDTDARLDLMRRLKDHFTLGAAGSNPALHEKFDAEGFPYHFYPLRREANPFADVRSVWRLWEMFRRVKPQLVHAFDTKPCVWACLAARLAGVPVVTSTVTGLGSLYERDTLGRRLAWRTYKILQTLACRVSDLTMFQNRDDLQYFVSENMTAAARTAFVPGSGVPTEVLCPERVSLIDCERVRKELGIQAGEIVVTMRSMGVLEFAEAGSDVRRRFPAARFLLIGPEDEGGFDRLTCEQRASLGKSLIWPGARRDIPTVLRLSHVFVLPTAYREGIPRVILEAAAMGLPIVTTDAPGCKEVVEGGINGILVPPHDAKSLAEAITFLIANPDLRRKFGEASRRRAVEKFDSALIAEQTRSIYEGLLAQKAFRQFGVSTPVGQAWYPEGELPSRNTEARS
jgi:glycosyltransferase involved in cell wall biosynthesis